MTRPAAQRPLGRGFSVLLAANFLQQSQLGAIVLVPPLLAALGADRARVGWLVGVGNASGVAAALTAGLALDRWGRKPVVIAGSVLSAAGLILGAALQRADWLALVMQLLISAGSASLLNGYYVWATDVIPEPRRIEGLCYFGASNLLPLALGYLPFELGSAGQSLRWCFIAASCAVAVSAVIAASALREPPRPERAESLRWRDIAGALISPALRPIWLLVFGFGGILELFATFATLAIADRVPGNPGVFWLCYAVTAAVLRVTGARLPARLGVARTMWLACVAAALAGLTIALAGSPASVAVAGVLGGAAHGYGYPALLTLLVGRAPAQLRGTVVAVLDALWCAVLVVLAPALGVAADWTGSDGVVFELGAAGALVTAVVWLGWERRLGRAPHGPA